MSLRLGEVLVSRGVLDTAQVAAVLEAQRDRARPFGLLAEELFGVAPADVEAAWVEQYGGRTARVDPLLERPQASALRSISRRQAWQFRVLPMGHDELGDLVLCTTEAELPRALRFAANCVSEPTVIVLCDAHALSIALAEHYPIAGFDTAELTDPTSLLGGSA